LNPWEKIVWFLTIGLTAGVLVKLWYAGLAKVYRLFFGYLAWDFLSSIGAALWTSYNTTWYGYYYVCAQTIKIVIAAFMLIEIYGLAMERAPALAHYLRSALGYILGAAGAIPVIWALLDHAAPNSPLLRAYLLFEQTMAATMAIFLILISIFIAWFPVRMRRNVIVYIGGFIVWSLSRSAALHLVSQWSGNKHLSMVVNSIEMYVILGCLLVWLLGLRREGETRTAIVGHLWNRAEAEHLTGQLDAINNSLERLRRR
jgi:hypothetical protein